MSITKENVLRVAALVELGVPDDQVDGLVRDIDNIVDYVSRLNELPAEEDAPRFHPGPAKVTLRQDVVAPVPLALTPEQMAPAFIDGLFVVPRLEGMDE